MPDLRQIDADFREWFGAAYQPCHVSGSMNRNDVYAAGAMALASTTIGDAIKMPVATQGDFKSLDSLHSAAERHFTKGR